MFVVFGTYNWSARLVAFRRDLCAHCQRETLSLGMRTLDFFHVFWIPILPLGRWTRWRCADCGNDPAQTTAVRRPYRLLLWILVAVMALAFVSVAEVDGDYAIPVWMGRVLAGVVIALVGWWAGGPFARRATKTTNNVVPMFSRTMKAPVRFAAHNSSVRQLRPPAPAASQNTDRLAKRLTTWCHIPRLVVAKERAA